MNLLQQICQKGLTPTATVTHHGGFIHHKNTRFILFHGFQFEANPEPSAIQQIIFYRSVKLTMQGIRSATRCLCQDLRRSTGRRQQYHGQVSLTHPSNQGLHHESFTASRRTRHHQDAFLLVMT